MKSLLERADRAPCRVEIPLASVVGGRIVVGINPIENLWGVEEILDGFTSVACVAYALEAPSPNAKGPQGPAFTDILNLV